jgi:hypothetical protein
MIVGYPGVELEESYAIVLWERAGVESAEDLQEWAWCCVSGSLTASKDMWIGCRIWG